MFKDEFRRDKWCFFHPDVEDFGLCCWQRDRKIKVLWMVWRVALFLYFFAVFLYIIFESLFIAPESDKFKIFEYLCFWTLSIQSSFAESAAVCTVWIYINQRNSQSEALSCFYWVMLWVEHTVAVVFTFLTTITFWAIDYDSGRHSLDATTVLLYIANLVFYIDFALSAIPFRFLHFYINVIFFLIYVLAALIYEAAGQHGMYGLLPLYKWLDWKYEPGQTALYVFLFLIDILIQQFIFFLLSYWKLRSRRNPGQRG